MKKLFISLFIILTAAAQSFSQEVAGTDFRVFNYSSFINSSKNYPITGMWNPLEIDRYSIMCIRYTEAYYAKEFVFICNEEQCNSWINSLTEMKELFLRNDRIAKENGVTSEINKDVSDKFTFEGFCGEGIHADGSARYGGRIVKPDSAKGEVFSIYVIYLYQEGKSLMRLYIKNHYLSSGAKLVWTFSSVQEFDEMINAINWSNFKEAKNTQVEEYLGRQNAAKAAADKQKREEALFD